MKLVTNRHNCQTLTHKAIKYNLSKLYLFTMFWTFCLFRQFHHSNVDSGSTKYNIRAKIQPSKTLISGSFRGVVTNRSPNNVVVRISQYAGPFWLMHASTKLCVPDLNVTCYCCFLNEIRPDLRALVSRLTALWYLDIWAWCIMYYMGGNLGWFSWGCLSGSQP